MSWYQITNQGSSTLKINILSEIGKHGVSAESFINEVEAHQGLKNIKLAIDSMGGSVFESIAIHNFLKSHPAHVEAEIIGTAASGASLIFMAADKRIMSENSLLMLHKLQATTSGDTEDLQRTIAVMQKLEATTVSIYSNRTGQPIAKIKSMLEQTTWMDGKEALQLGFTDELRPAQAIAACTDISKIPTRYHANFTQPLGFGIYQNLEAACQSEWRVNPKVRKEFLNEYENYLAFHKAQSTGQAGAIIGNKIIKGVK